MNGGHLQAITNWRLPATMDLYWTELKAIVRCLKVNYFVWHSYCLIFYQHKIYFDTSEKLNFGNEKPLWYSRDNVITKFDINRFEIQSNIGEMLGNGWSLRHMQCIRDKQVWHSAVDLYVVGLTCMKKLYEPQHEISNNVVCATSKASGQPAHMCSLIRAFASCLNILWVLNYWLNIIWSL